jgi:hypothetical protein
MLTSVVRAPRAFPNSLASIPTDTVLKNDGIMGNSLLVSDFLFVLAGKDREYEIVDGQQRLTALTMTIHALWGSPTGQGRTARNTNRNLRQPGSRRSRVERRDL